MNTSPHHFHVPWQRPLNPCKPGLEITECAYFDPAAFDWAHDHVKGGDGVFIPLERTFSTSRETCEGMINFVW